MIEKRFFQIGSNFIDTVKKEKTKDWNNVIDWLNEVHKENQQLKHIIDKQEMKLAEYNNQNNEVKKNE